MKVANRVFTHSAPLRCASFVHTLFAFTSGLAGSSAKKQKHAGLCSSSQASNESTVSCKRYGTATRTLRFLHLPVSAGGPIVAVSTLFVKAAKCHFALNMHRSENKCRPRRSQLKTAGTQKVFPLSPLRTPLTPSQKNKECNPSLGGTGGTLFAQHYSCPAVLRCSHHR